MRRAWIPGDPASEWTPMLGRTSLKSIRACERGDWWLWAWPKEGPGHGTPVRVPFLCGSWRCRRCGRWRGALDFCRCRDGLKKHGRWCYVVLTTDPADWSNPWSAQRRLGEGWDHGLKRAIEYSIGKIEYLQTWESFTKSRFPHLNLVFQAKQLEAFIRTLGGTKFRVVKNSKGNLVEKEMAPGFRRWLRPHAMRAGFGRIIWVEMLDDRNATMAGYLLKLAEELTGATPESTGKALQAPLDAPPHFRRIRASRGLLPPILKHDGGFTGMLDIGTRSRDPDEATAPRRKPGEKRYGEPLSWQDVNDRLLAPIIEAEKREEDIGHRASLLVDDMTGKVSDERFLRLFRSEPKLSDVQL